MYKCKHFGIKELVSKIVFTKYGEAFCWKFFDEAILRDLDTIREFHNKAIIINNWATGGSFSQCGFRSNMDPMVKAKNTLYCSAHCMGKAFDLHSSDVRKLYKDVQTLYNLGKLHAIQRMESPNSTKYGWCHVDSFQKTCKGLEIFTA